MKLKPPTHTHTEHGPNVLDHSVGDLPCPIDVTLRLLSREECSPRELYLGGDVLY